MYQDERLSSRCQRFAEKEARLLPELYRSSKDKEMLDLAPSMSWCDGRRTRYISNRHFAEIRITCNEQKSDFRFQSGVRANFLRATKTKLVVLAL
ncbi:hypothetical protein CDAR_540831 [Caerostris darwini]|uniref:Uncharacterized protein n=1 Tax=Caerostris darwini TaxID=1538125 RepID=A0AAV4VI42_9ARAC|nr:hypothetical protein CDAR_540831 [Caerostris darwini]